MYITHSRVKMGRVPHFFDTGKINLLCVIFMPYTTFPLYYTHILQQPKSSSRQNDATLFLLLCRSGAYAPCAYPRICSNCAIACFHILFIPSAYACGHPRICSNCASACFHILGFIASGAKQSSKLCPRVCARLYSPGSWGLHPPTRHVARGPGPRMTCS